MRTFFRQCRPAAVSIVVFTVLLGVIYPLAVTAVAQVGFSHRANGSLITVGPRRVGSALIGQSFTSPGYFHSRPSAAGTGYDASASAGSNLGPTNEVLLNGVGARIEAFRTENGLGPNVKVPVDAVTVSASGLSSGFA